jgi:antitoxin PrlF
MTAVATITSKSRTTIPKEIRDGLGLKPNDRVHFTLLADGTVIMRAKKRSIGDAYGILHRPRRNPVPLSGMKR